MTTRREWQAKGFVPLLYGSYKNRKRALAIEPGFHNVLGLEAAFKKQPIDMDYINPASSFYYLKNLSTKIYQRFLNPHLRTIPKESIVLDAGCGIGRFTLILAKRFAKVVAFDPCLSSLKACKRHLVESGLSNVELHWADLSFLDEWEENFFDAVFAIELICYTANPLKSLKRLIRVAKPNAKIFLSVEGRYGALCAQGAGGLKNLKNVLLKRSLLLENDRFVVYFDREEFEKLVLRAGLRDVVIEESHYFGEGVFWQSIDDSRLNDPKYVKMIIEAEKLCRLNSLVANWARVFSAVGKK